VSTALRAALRVLLLAALAVYIRAHWPFRSQLKAAAPVDAAPSELGAVNGKVTDATAWRPTRIQLPTRYPLTPPMPAAERWRSAENFTTSARQVMACAHLQAYTYRCDHVGTEHVLMALIDGEHDGALRALRRAGAIPDQLRECIDEAIGPALPPRATHLPFSTELKCALDCSVREVRLRNHSLIDVTHILYGLFAQPECAASRFVIELGARPISVRRSAFDIDIAGAC
jgi:hypothetical protein